MARLVGVYENNDQLRLGVRQLALPVDDNKVMVMQLSDVCETCKLNREVCDNFEAFIQKYRLLGKDRVVAALIVSSKELLNRLIQEVNCVGCRRSVERMFSELKISTNPALEPLLITSDGVLSVQRNVILQPKVLYNLFNSHSLPLYEVLENIPKLRKSGRCLIHSMEGVRCSGSKSWVDVWSAMTPGCKEAVSLVNNDHLLNILDDYLRKHRFCQECKNKVHRAFNILIGQAGIDLSKEKGYVSSLYSGIRKCPAKGHIHISVEKDYIRHLISKAEPELLGRRERHAKTLEIAQEEVLTCLGLYLLERLHRIFSKMREEEQTWNILFHVSVDILQKNFEVAVDDMQGVSKFEMCCEELQKQEIKEKSKKQKKKKRKKNKKNDEGKENNYSCEEDEISSCKECDKNSSGHYLCLNCSSINAFNNGNGNSISYGNHLVDSVNYSHQQSCDSKNAQTSVCSVKCCSGCGNDKNSNSRFNDEKASFCINSNSFLTNFNKDEKLVDCRTSMDSLVSGNSQGSRDGGYCSAAGSGGSSRDSSEVACGEGLCSHFEEHNLESADLTTRNQSNCSEAKEIFQNLRAESALCSSSFAFSLQDMLEKSTAEEVEEPEIPEAEVKAWHARLGIVRQKRAELRQTLLNRFQQLCHQMSPQCHNQCEAQFCIPSSENSWKERSKP